MNQAHAGIGELVFGGVRTTLSEPAKIKMGGFFMKRFAMLLVLICVVSALASAESKPRGGVLHVVSFPLRHPVRFSKHLSLYDAASKVSYPARHPRKTGRKVKAVAF